MIRAHKLVAPVAIIVPVGATEGEAHSVRWKAFKKDVARIAGGFTVTAGNGGYIFQKGPRAGELIEETVLRLEARLLTGTIEEKGKALLDAFKDYLEYLITQAGEEAVFVELPGSDGGAFIAYDEPEEQAHAINAPRNLIQGESNA